MSLVTRPVALFVVLAGCRPTYDHDVAGVIARYPHRVDTTCHSWLYSYKTGFPYCASPAFTAVLPEKPKMPEIIDTTKIDQASLMARGEKVYTETCAVCHGADGKGTAGSFPPLAGSGGFYGDNANHIGIVLAGLSGPITVQGVAYNGVMPPQAMLSDYDIASVVTYERNSWGNADGIALPDEVKAARAQ